MLPWFRNPSILILCSLLQSSISHSALSEDLALVVAGGDGQGLEVEVRVLFVERFKHFDFHRQFLLKKKVWTPTMNCALPDLPSMVEWSLIWFLQLKHKTIFFAFSGHNTWDWMRWDELHQIWAVIGKISVWIWLEGNLLPAGQHHFGNGFLCVF